MNGSEIDSLLARSIQDYSGPFIFCAVEKLLQERQEDAAVLRFKCNRIGMSDEETNDLRNEIKVLQIM